VTPDEIAARVLDAGAYDWVSLGAFPTMLGQATSEPTPPALIEEGIATIFALLREGYVEVGDIRRGEGFVPWSVTPDEARDRIRTAWSALDHAPYPGDVCWLANTSLGDARARELRSRPD